MASLSTCLCMLRIRCHIRNPETRQHGSMRARALAFPACTLAFARNNQLFEKNKRAQRLVHRGSQSEATVIMQGESPITASTFLLHHRLEECMLRMTCVLCIVSCALVIAGFGFQH